MRNKTEKLGGFSLVELVITIVVLAIVLAGVMGAWSYLSSHSADPLPRAQAINVAEGYLEEIRLKRYGALSACPAVPPPGGRSRFTHTCHYQGLVDNGARDQFGNAIPNLADYVVSVNIVQSPDLPGIPASDAQRITVTVDAPNGETIALSAYRAKEWP